MKATFIGLVLSLVLASMTLAQPPAPPKVADDDKQKLITISPETTFIVEPLDHAGFPDYLEFLNRELNQGGIPSTENAAAVLLEIIDRDQPGLPLNVHYRAKLYQRLQVPLPAIDDEPYVSWFTYLEKAQSKTPDVPLGGFETPAHEYPASTPWTSKDRSLMTEWIESPGTRRALEHLEEMTSRPRFALPYLGSDDQDTMTNLSMILLPWASYVRDLGRLLKTQAMYDLGEGRFEEASSRLIQLHRLAELHSQQMFVIEKLTSIAIDSTACEADVIFAQDPDLPTEILKRHAKRLAELPPLDDMSHALSKAERVLALNAVCMIAQLRLPKPPANQAEIERLAKELSGGNPILSKLFSTLIDDDVAIRNLNQYFDRFVQISQLPYWEREEAFEKMSQDFQLNAIESLTIPQMLLQSPQERGEMLAKQVFNQFAVLDHTTTSQDRSRMKRELVHVVYALELYHRTHGNYPEELSQLVPAQLTVIPRDRFSDQPLSYELKTGHYKLECAGYRPLLNGKPSPLKFTSTGWIESE